MWIQILNKNIKIINIDLCIKNLYLLEDLLISEIMTIWNYKVSLYNTKVRNSKKTKLSNSLRIKSVYDNDCFTSKNYTCTIITGTNQNKLYEPNMNVHCSVVEYRRRVVLLRSWEEVVGTQGKLKHRCPPFGLIEWDSTTKPALERTGHNQNKRWTCVLFFFLFALPRLCSWRIFFILILLLLVNLFWLILLLLAIF